MWERGGVVIAPNQKYKITRIQDQHTLKVFNTDQNDVGEYICHLHNTVGDTSHACHLHVTDQVSSRKSDAVNALKSRLSRLQGQVSTLPYRQESPGRGGEVASSPESTRRFRQRKEGNLGDTDGNTEAIPRKGATETLTNRAAGKETATLNWKSSGVTANTAADNLNPGEGQHQHYQNMHSSGRSNHNSKGVVRITVRSNETSPRTRLEFKQKTPENNFRAVLNKSQVKHEVKDVRNVIPQGDEKVVDFRSVLKHRQSESPPSDTSKAPKPKDIDFQEVLSKSKPTEGRENKFKIVVTRGRLVGSELKNLQIERTSRNVLSRSGEFMSSSPVVSSSFSSPSSSIHQDGSQTERGVAYRRSGAKVNSLGLKSVNKTLGALDVPAVSISVEPPQSARQTYRKVRQYPTYSPSSSLHFEDVSKLEDSIEPDSESQSTTERVSHVVTVNRPIGESSAQASFVEHSDESFATQDLENESLDTQEAQPVFKSEIVVHETRASGREPRISNMYPPTERAFNMTVSSPVPAKQIKPVSGHVTIKDHKLPQQESHFSSESECKTSTAESERPQSADSSPLRARYIEITPQVSFTPPAASLKPVITSVSVTIPSSSLSPSLPKSVSSRYDFEEDVSTSDTSIRQDDNDEVFTEDAAVNSSGSPRFGGGSPRTDKRKSTLSYGAVYTWEKSPWINSEGKMSDDLTEKFATSQGTWDKNVRERVMRNSRSRYSEHLSRNDDIQDEDSVSPARAGASSKAIHGKSKSLSSPSTSASRTTASAADNAVDDFRSVKLKHATTSASKNSGRKSSDFSKSKFMSKSTESIFTDIKLKPVPKADDALKRSKISTNAESIRAKSKSSYFSSDISSSFSQGSPPRQNAAVYSARDSRAASPSKISDRRKTFHDDTLKGVKHQSPENTAKSTAGIKTEASSGMVAGSSVPPTKSKGIGAKFEAALKDSKDIGGFKAQTLPRTTSKKNQDTLASHASGSLPRSAGISEKLQKWTAADAASAGKPARKTLGMIGKSSSNNAILSNSGGTSNLDKVPEWVRLKAVNKRYSLQMDKAPTLPLTSARERRLVPKEDASKTPRFLKNDNGSLDESRLNKTEGFQDKLELSEKENVGAGERSDWRKTKDEPSSNGIKYQSLSKSKDTANDGSKYQSVSKPVDSTISKKKTADEQGSVPEWLNRKPVKNIEEKIRSKAGSKTGKEEPPPEWVKIKSPRDIKQNETTSDRNKASRFEYDTSRHAHREQQDPKTAVKAAGPTSVTKANPDTPEKDVKTRQLPSPVAENVTTNDDEISTNGIPTGGMTVDDDKDTMTTYNAETHSKSAEAIRTSVIPETIVSVSSAVSVSMTTSVITSVPTTSTMITANADTTPTVSVIPASPAPSTSRTIVTETTTTTATTDTSEISSSGASPSDGQGWSEVNGDDDAAAPRYTHSARRRGQEPTSDFSDRRSSGSVPKEVQQHNQHPPLKNTNVKPSWMKQKSMRHIPIYPIHDNELSPRIDPLRAPVDDSESVVSTASISSSSSDASTVTNDSGYPRSRSRELVDEVKTQPTSEAPAHEDDESKSRILRESHEIGKAERRQASNTSEDLESSADISDTDQNALSNQDLTNDEITNTKEVISKDETSRAFSTLRNSQISRKPDSVDEKEYTRGYAWRRRDGDKSSPASSIDKSSESSAGFRDSEKGRVRDSRFSNDPGYISSSTKRRHRLRDEDNDDSKSLPGKPNKNETAIPAKVMEDTCSESESNSECSTVSDSTLEPKSTTAGIDKGENSDSGRNARVKDPNSEPKVNGSTLTSDHEGPRSKFGRRFKEDKSAVESATATSGLRSKVEESPQKFSLRSREKVSYLSSEPKDSDSEFSRIRSKFSDRFREDNEKRSSGSIEENETSAKRPSELGLDPNWRSSRSRLPKKEDSLATATTATSKSASSTATSAAASEQPPPPQQCPPSFPLPLCETTAMYGSQAVLQCQVAGNPRPDVRWLLNQIPVQSSQGIELSYTDDTARLTVLETFPEHVGEYTCCATNTLGTASTHCQLVLEASNKTEGRAFEGPVSLPPRIVSLTPRDVSLPRDSALTLTVTFVGEPAPTVKWTQAGKDLTSDGRTKIVTEKNTSCLTIESVGQSDAGKMSVCLTSGIGTDQASANICIEDVPGAPVGQPHVYDIGRNSASLSWCGPVSSGGSPVTYYIIEAKTRHEKTWDVIVPQCKELSYHILELKPCTTYQFRIRAVNRHGLGAPSEPSERVITTDPFRSPSDYDSEDDLPFEPRDVKINTKDKFEDLYALDKEVGKGKFGVVYKCKLKKDDTIWAAKIVKCREKDKGALRMEVEIMNKLRHPKLLLLWDAFEAPRQIVLVMEYVGAGELFERVIGEDFVLTERDCTHFLRQICEGVSYMHSNCILHLDLKPENILCIAENSNRIKIIDFGLARVYNPGESTKVLFGTPEFIAPEVINYEEIGFGTDMWSVGVICYVLLSGLSPFLGDSDAETLASVTSGEFDFDDEAFDEISDQAKDFISKLLVKKKEDRLLTEQCLAHDWLNQDDVDGMRYKRLNTERLKRFMVRRKWLKTGNAVLAVSRLLKSSSLTSFGSLSRSNSNDSVLSTPSPTTTPRSLVLQQTTEEDVEEEEEEEGRTEQNISGLSPSKNLASLQDGGNNAVTDISNGQNDDCTQSNETSPKKRWRNTDQDVAVTNTRDKSALVNRSAEQNIKAGNLANQNTDQNDNQLIDRNSQISAQDYANQNVVDTTSATKSTQLVQSSLTQSPSSLLSSPQTSAAQSLSQPKGETNLTGSGNTNKLQAPVFTKSMTHCKACAGDVARFDVIISGEPLPQVTWFFEDEEIPSDSRHTVDFNERTRSYSLIVRSIEEEDEGEYACKAVNSQGETTCVAELSVLEF